MGNSNPSAYFVIVLWLYIYGMIRHLIPVRNLLLNNAKGNEVKGLNESNWIAYKGIRLKQSKTLIFIFQQQVYSSYYSFVGIKATFLVLVSPLLLIFVLILYPMILCSHLGKNHAAIIRRTCYRHGVKPN